MLKLRTRLQWSSVLRNVFGYLQTRNAGRVMRGFVLRVSDRSCGFHTCQPWTRIGDEDLSNGTVEKVTTASYN